ncbi:hypothetical protein Bca52824_079596 [Brassica carinata]|uniref:Beta-hexosaminidase n=1 Tax=Brassica carinata TaxID=52824 RepID=A0A8X7PZL0_BRACI|nr:hypothetical protein Bca52824_079596 [Brassica carinata]
MIEQHLLVLNWKSHAYVPQVSCATGLLCLASSPWLSSAIPINIWPKPRFLSWPQHKAITLSPDFTITSPQHQYLSASVTRYHNLIRSDNYSPLITSSIKLIKGHTLSKLVVTVTDLFFPFTTDSPLFGHRGVLLDTSRNYYGVEDITRTIRAMSANKLNVFHWHITDSHSFPLVLPSEPSLAAKGSYGPVMVYTPADVSMIVQFGLEHGVRVLPEIDTPGHTGSWGEAYPEIVTCGNMFWLPAGKTWDERLASEPGTGQLNPLNPKTYEVVKNVIRDVAKLFPEPFFHGGGDEVIPGCWKTDPAITSFLSSGGTLSQLLEKYINSTLPYIVSQNRTAVYWEDVLLDAKIKVDSSVLPKGHTILQTWNNGNANTKRIVAAGYRVIVSSSEYYYLDCGHGGFLGNDSQYDQQGGGGSGGGSWCAPFKTWQSIYNYDITDGLVDEEERKMVLGGEVALWSEQADPTVLDSRLWPRASAFAESLWSGNRDERGVKRCGEALDRLNRWRYRMVKRGIGAEPIQPLWCLKNPGMCNAPVHGASEDL